MKTTHTIRSVVSPFIPLLAAASAWAGSWIGFETVGPNAATDSLVLAQQFRPTMGIRFSRADGGSVTLAKSAAQTNALYAMLREVLNPEGIKASDLTAAQRAILLDLIGKGANIIHEDASATKMASIRTTLPDPTNATYFSWRGPTTAGSAAYYRIQGPNLFIEWAPQSMGGAATNHIHAMYRELANDYGALIPQ